MQHLKANRALGLMILAGTLLICASPLVAEEASTDPTTPPASEAKAPPSDGALEQILCAAPAAELAPTEPIFDLEGQGLPEDPVSLTCSAVANCQTGQISCSGGCPADRRHANCPSERGWVSCGGVKKYCPSCTCTPDLSCTGRACSSHSNCTNGTCPNGFCGPLGTCMCVF